MRILVVSQYYYPERFTITPIAEALAKRGHKVTVLTGKPNYGFGGIVPGYENKTYEERNGVKIHRVNLVPRTKGKLSIIRNYLSFHRNSIRFIKRFKEEFDVVYTMSLSPLMSVEAGEVYAKKHNVPCFIHCLDLWPESAVAAGQIRKGGLAYKILYRWSKKIYSRSTAVLISSPSFADYFRDVLKMPEHPLIELMQPPLEPLIESEAHSYGKEGKHVVYAGNIGSLQLVEIFVEATSLLKPEEKLILHIYGTGSREPEVRALVESKHLQDRVHLHGFKEPGELSSFLKGADALIVSLKDGDSPVHKTIPNKLITSLECGKPILASIGGDGHKILEQSGGAFFVKEDPESIAEGYRKILSSREDDAKEMGEKNLSYFKEHFEFERILDQLEEILSDSRTN